MLVQQFGVIHVETINMVTFSSIVSHDLVSNIHTCYNRPMYQKYIFSFKLMYTRKMHEAWECDTSILETKCCVHNIFTSIAVFHFSLDIDNRLICTLRLDHTSFPH